MSRPKAYDPQQGYQYQIFTKQAGEREWEHCDYAKDRKEKNQLVSEYRMAYGVGFTFKSELLPVKYHKAQ